MKTEHKHTFADEWELIEQVPVKNSYYKHEKYEGRRCLDESCRVLDVKKSIVTIFK